MIDSHAHLNFDSFDPDRATVIERTLAADVGWIEVGTDLAQSRRAVALAEPLERVWASVGVHPSDIATLTPAQWDELAVLAQHPKVVAIGEVGVDFYRGGTAEEQLPVLRQFIELAHQHALPVIFHVRNGAVDAHDTLITFLHELPGNLMPAGVIHTFSGNRAQAEAYLKLGLHLSFSGVVTFKNAGEITDVATTTPLDRLLIETDCPFLAPEPYRGKRNEPLYVQYVAEKIAQLRDLSVEEVQTATEHNTQTLFKL
ncbi:MAG: TatD family hydrolase [Candidatus Andersenbacteria bacterium]